MYDTVYDCTFDSTFFLFSLILFFCPCHVFYFSLDRDLLPGVYLLCVTYSSPKLLRVRCMCPFMVATHGLVVQSSSNTSSTSKCVATRVEKSFPSCPLYDPEHSFALDRVKTTDYITRLSFFSTSVFLGHRRCFAIEVLRYSFKRF